MNIKKSGINLVSVFLLSIFGVSFVSAELCQWSDGYWRGCSSSYSGKSMYYSSSYLTGKRSTISSVVGYDGRYDYNKKITKGYDHQYKNSYNNRRVVDKTKSKYDYYKLIYDLDYKTETGYENYGYDRFTHNKNGYDHEYMHGYRTYEKGYVKGNYEEITASGSSYSSSPHY